MSLAQQFQIALAAAKNTHAVDETARLLWRAHAEAQIPDAEAEAICAAIAARRAALAGNGPASPPRPAPGCPGAAPRGLRRREKMFGLGRPRALDRNAKVRIMHLARCLSRRTEKGRAYGAVTAKALAVLEALLWAFHNARSGLCFPSYETIAEAAGCARSTVAEAHQGARGRGGHDLGPADQAGPGALPDLFGDEGWRWRVLRTSNAYHFTRPGPACQPSKSEKPTGTPNQVFFSSLRAAFGGERTALRAEEGLCEEEAGANVGA